MEGSNNIEDKIDWKKIDQLHNATVNFSKSSLEIKKLLFVVIGISTPLIINLSDNKLDASLFISLYIILIPFWIFDSYTYYYQKKLRATMDSLFIEIRNRNTDNTSDVFETELQTMSQIKLILRALFNLSHICFYGVLLVLITLVLILYLCGIIR